MVEHNVTKTRATTTCCSHQLNKQETFSHWQSQGEYFFLRVPKSVRIRNHIDKIHMNFLNVISRLLNNSLVRLVSTSHRYRYTNFLYRVFFIKKKKPKNWTEQISYKQIHTCARCTRWRIRYMRPAVPLSKTNMLCTNTPSVWFSIYFFLSSFSYFVLDFFSVVVVVDGDVNIQIYRLYDFCLGDDRMRLRTIFLISCCIVVLDAATVWRVCMFVSVLCARMCGRGKQQNTMRKRRKRKMKRDERKRKRNNE